MLTKVIRISLEEIERLQAFLDSKGKDVVDTVATFTAKFDDGIEIDIKVCDGNPPFVDAVLFQDGSDVGCLDVTDTLVGEYIFHLLGNNTEEIYKVIVVVDEVKNMNWDDLAVMIQGLTPEQRKHTACVYNYFIDEFIDITDIAIQKGDDRICDNDPYIISTNEYPTEYGGKRRL